MITQAKVKKVKQHYILWVGGVELGLFDELRLARDEAEEWIARGYDDVIIEEKDND